MVASEVTGKLDDLADVVAGVAERARNRERHGVGFAADRDRLVEVGSRQAVERLEQTGPASFPVIENLGSALKAVHKFAVAVTARLFPIRR